MENNKVKAVKEQSIPTKIKEVESFLGFTNFHRRFIKNFSHMARSLNELKEKKEWSWTDEHQRAFEKLKEKITSQPVLSLPKRKGKFKVETDASGHTIRSSFSRTRREIETYSIFIKNNATSGKKLQNL